MKHFLSFVFVLLTFAIFGQEDQENPIEAIIQMGHSKTITAADISHNGKYIATGSIDRSIIIWDKKTGKEIRILHHHVKSIRALHFSPDDKHILSSSNDNTVKLTNVETGEVVHTYHHEKYEIANAMFNGDGSKVLIFDKRQHYSIWDTYSGELIGTFEKDYAAFNDAYTVSHNGELALTKIDYSKVACVNLISKDTVFTMPFSKAYTLNFSPDGKYIVVGSAKLFSTVFDGETGDYLHSVSVAQEMGCDGCKTKVAISNDSKSVFTTSNKGLGKVWDIKNGKIIATINTPERFPNAIEFSADNDEILVSYNEAIKVFSAQTGKEKLSIESDNLDYYHAQLQNGQFVVPGDNQSADLWSASSKRAIKNYKGYLNAERSDGLDFSYSSWVDVSILQYISYRTSLAIHPNNQEIVLGKIDSAAVVLDLKTGKKTKTLTEAHKAVFCQAYSHDGKYLAVAGGDRNIRIYDAKTYALLHTLVGHRNLIFDIQFSDDSNILSSASWDGFIYTWNIAENTVTSSIETGKSAPYVLRYSPNDLYLLTGDLYKNVVFWEADTKEPFRTLIGHMEPISGIEFSKNGAQVVTSSWDGKIKLWHTLTGMQLAKFNDKGAPPVYAVNFSPEQTHIISGDGDRKIKFWNIETGQLDTQLSGHISAVTDIQLTSDGQFMVSRGMNGEVIVWDYAKKKQLYTYLPINRNDWLIKTPSGHFDGSKKALQLVNYVSGMEVINIESLFDKYYTPGLASKIMAGEDMDDTGENLNTLIKNRPELAFQISNSKKRTLLVNSDSIVESRSQLFSVDVAVLDNHDDIEEVRIYNNDKLVARRSTNDEIVFRGGKNVETFEIALIDGINNLKAVASNKKEVESDPVTLQIKFDGEAAKVDLYILTVGINKYKNNKYDLSFAVNDAKDFSKTIAKGGNTLFNKIHTYALEDNKATKAEIKSLFEALKQNVGPEDVFVFYYAGHGLMSVPPEDQEADFYIVTHNITNFYAQDVLEKEGVSATELMDFSKQIAAQKQLFILDACHSGGALNALTTRGAGTREKAIAQLARNTGTFFLTASQDAEYANESGDLKHGLFTYALLEILGGATALSEAGNEEKVTVNEIKTYVEERVPELSEKYHGSAQYPTSYSFGQDFPIVILK